MVRIIPMFSFFFCTNIRGFSGECQAMLIIWFLRPYSTSNNHCGANFTKRLKRQAQTSFSCNVASRSVSSLYVISLTEEREIFNCGFCCMKSCRRLRNKRASSTHSIISESSPSIKFCQGWRPERQDDVLEP